MPQRKAILVVDDCHDTTDSFSSLLRIWGYTPVPAYDGQEAIKFATQNDLLAAIIDVSLPDMSGLDVAKFLRTTQATGPILITAMSGYGRPDDVQAALLAGCDHHLIKPVDLMKLRALLATHRLAVSGTIISGDIATRNIVTGTCD